MATCGGIPGGSRVRSFVLRIPQSGGFRKRQIRESGNPAGRDSGHHRAISALQGNPRPLRGRVGLGASGLVYYRRNLVESRRGILGA